MPGAKLKIIFWWVGLLLLGPGGAGAQYTIRHIDGRVLPGADNLYWASHTSGDLFYLAGKRGLLLFDGQQATPIPLEEANGSQRFDQHMQSPPVEDNQGNIWVSTPGFLHGYDPHTNQWRNYQFQRDGKLVTADYKIFHYSPESDKLWVATEGALWSFDTRTSDYAMLSTENKSRFLALSPRQTFIAGLPWGKTVTIHQLNSENTVIRTRHLQLAEIAISVAFASADSIVYVGTKKGLGKIQLGTDTLSFELILPTGPVSDLRYDDSRNCLWLNLKRRGILCYNLSTGKTEASFNSGNGLSGEDNSYLSLDDAGRLWVSIANHGFDVLEPAKANFTSPGPAMTATASDMVLRKDGTVLVIDRTGVLYSGYPEGKGYRWSADSTDYPGGSNRLMNAQFFTWRDRLVVTSDFATAEASSGDQPWTIYRKEQNHINGAFLAPDGSTIVLTPQGVRGITFDQDSVFNHPVRGFERVPSESCVKLFQLTDSAFVLSYQDQEIWPCRLTATSTYRLEARIPLAGDLNGVVIAPDGRRYAGATTGLYELRDDTVLPLLTTLRGQTVLSVETLTFDNEGRLWLGTKAGLLSYRPEDGAVSFYGKADGLQDERFLDLPSIQQPNGYIWMMTASGITGFDPGELSRQFTASQPMLTGIWVNNLPYQDSLRPAYLKLLKQPYQSNTLTFTFSTTGLESSPLTAIEYQLADYDLAPLRAAPGQDIRYPNLPPGKYKLAYAAVNRNGLISGSNSLEIIIGKPFYQTWAFYLACTCVLALIAAGLYITGLRRERLKQQRLHEQQARLAAERDRIAGEVHDDLGGQISSILYLSEEMLLAGTAPDNERELHRIHELSRNSLQNVRDIIFALDNRRATLADLGEQLRGAGEVFFGDRKIGFNCTDTFDRPAFELTSRQKRNLTLIVKEAWHNIAKHARATEVTVDLQEESDLLRITIADNGVGFTDPRSANGMGGFGLENMQEKATAIGGNLAIDSTPGRGTRLTLNWPITN